VRFGGTLYTSRITVTVFKSRSLRRFEHVARKVAYFTTLFSNYDYTASNFRVKINDEFERTRKEETVA
jgi:hypothetical protein